jgi:hypothetical protein
MTRSLFYKFNQTHNPDGRFGGPGGSHDPTGNPVGRPGTGGPGQADEATAHQGPSFGQIAGATTGAAGGAAIGGWLGAGAAGIAGEAVGGPIGGWIAGKVGQYAGSVIGSMAGDYVGTKIASALVGLKAGADQHGIGVGAAVGETAAEAAAFGATRLLPGGNAVRGLFNMTNYSLASEGAKAAVETVGGIAGGVAGSKNQDSKTLDHAGKANSAIGAGKTIAGAVKRLKKSQLTYSGYAKAFHDKPPASYDGHFGSMVNSSLPSLFGPRQWKKVAGTPFAQYIQQRVKLVAEKMDDAADSQGIDVTPAKPQEVQQASGVLVAQHQKQQQAAQQQQQEMQMQQAQAAGQGAAAGSKPPPPAGQPKSPAGKPSPFGKLFVQPKKPLFAMPNDAVSRNALQTGGKSNTDFLARMQESDRQSRLVSLTRAFAQPGAASLQRAPSEDERQYNDRMNRVMAASVANSRLRPPGGVGAGSQGLSGHFPQQSTRYSVSLKKGAKRSTKLGKDGWTITAEIAKGLNSEDTLKQGLVFGWASIIEKGGSEITDHQGDRITEEELVKGAHDFISNSRQGGVLHDEYGKNIGHIVESCVFTHELQKHLGIDLGKVGWLIGYKIEDARVKTLVKSGVLKAFSIGGRGRRVPAVS